MKLWLKFVLILIGIAALLMVLSTLFLRHHGTKINIRTHEVSVKINNQQKPVSNTANGVAVTHTYELAAFNQVTIYNSFNLNLKIGKVQKVSISIPTEDLPEIKMRVSDGILSVGWQPGAHVTLIHPATVNITVPSLNHLNLYNQVNAVVTGMNAATLRLKEHNQSTLQISGRVGTLSATTYNNSILDASGLTVNKLFAHVHNLSNVKLHVTGSVVAKVRNFAAMTLSGKVRTAVLSADNSAKLYASHLIADSMQVTAVNNSHVYVNVVNSLYAKAENMSKIQYYGQPKKVRISSGSMSHLTPIKGT